MKDNLVKLDKKLHLSCYITVNGLLEHIDREYGKQLSEDDIINIIEENGLANNDYICSIYTKPQCYGDIYMMSNIGSKVIIAHAMKLFDF